MFPHRNSVRAPAVNSETKCILNISILVQVLFNTAQDRKDLDL